MSPPRCERRKAGNGTDTLHLKMITIALPHLMTPEQYSRLAPVAGAGCKHCAGVANLVLHLIHSLADILGLSQRRAPESFWSSSGNLKREFKNG